MLTVIDELCRQNNIKYILYAGTLLGAVRHSGFIPWDDDLDIAMLREDYEKFLAIRSDMIPDQYLIESYHTNINYPFSFAKFRKNDTVYVEKTFENLDIHHGIYVDIFPLDGIWKPFYKIQTMLLMKIQALRNYKLYESNEIIRSPFVKILTNVTSLRFLRWTNEVVLKIFSKKNNENVNQLCHGPRLWPIFKREQFLEQTKLKFEDKYFSVPKDYDLMLRQCYGDYMQLPPENKRIPKHDVIKCKL